MLRLFLFCLLACAGVWLFLLYTIRESDRFLYEDEPEDLTEFQGSLCLKYSLRNE